MKGVIAILQDFEKIVYKILMWVILIPKTLFRVVLNPLSFRDYVEQEEKDATPFDEYLSPVILLLVVAFLPAIAYNSLPTFGSVIHSPAETKPITDRYVQFESQTDFKGRETVDSKYIHTWTVDEIRANGIAHIIADETHSEGDVNSRLEKVDKDTVKDQFLYNFPSEKGEYRVNVTVKRVDTENDDRVIEKFTASILVNIPFRIEDPITISNTAMTATSETATFADTLKDEGTIFLALGLMIPPLLFAFASRFLLNKKAIEEAPAQKEEDALEIKATVEIAGETIKKNLTFPVPKQAEKTDKPASDEDSKSAGYVSIGEETLKRSFYVQCYFFSPLGLAIWGTIYANYFFTDDVFGYPGESLRWQIILLPLVACAMWFFRTEVKYFTLERKTSSAWAVTIALICISILGLFAHVIVSFDAYRDLFRVWTIRAFPMIAVILIGAFFYAWYNRRRMEQEKILDWNGRGLIAVVILFFGVMFVIPYAMQIVNAPSSGTTTSRVQSTAVAVAGAVTDAAPTPIVEATQVLATSVSLQPTPTPVSALPSPTLPPDLATPTPVIDQPLPTSTLELFTSTPSPFYVDEFNGDLAAWFEFMTSGDPRMVERDIELGKLSIKLLQLEDKLPWYYLISDRFTYSDVKMEAVVTNKGNNANGVSLICRYSDIGWYEFVVSNSGSYTIYAVDNVGIVNQGRNPVANGSSTAIKSGPGAVNVYAITCQGDKLDLSINGRQVKTLNEKKFGFPGGRIGLAVSSPEKLPVWIEFETLTVSEP